MKTKAIAQKKLSKKQFFLLLVAPFLLGLVIFFSSMAKAEWGGEDPNLTTSPELQGWAQVTFSPYTPLIQKETPVAIASR